MLCSAARCPPHTHWTLLGRTSARIPGIPPPWSVALDGIKKEKSAPYLCVRVSRPARRMSSVCILECVAAHLATMELSVKHVVLLSFGHQTVARCASATHMVAVTPSLASAPATPIAGVSCAKTPANVPATVNATPSAETAPVTRAGGCQPVPSRASVSPGAPWAPTVTS